jgi:hypothetical protein
LKRLGEALRRWSPADGAPAHWDPNVLLTVAWPEIVGEKIARNCAPARIAAGVLTVVTRSNAWSQQLTFFEDRMLAAVRARAPAAGIERLRFRVGQLPGPTKPAPARRPRSVTPRAIGAAAAEPPQTAGEAVTRFRKNVEAGRRAKRSAGWKTCEGCNAPTAPQGPALCTSCANRLAARRDAEAARLLFEAPWLGYAGIAGLVGGLTRKEYDALRLRTLSRWWETLVRARAAKRLSRDGRERLIASSYVVLKSALPPEEIEPATVRNVLGDELHDLLYGTDR